MRTHITSQNDMPFMNEFEVAAISSAISMFNKPINVLEWGSGNSTTYFSSQTKEGSEWLSIEHDLHWAKKINANIQNNNRKYIRVVHVPNSEYWIPGEGDGTFSQFKDYVLFPVKLRKKYDLIIVDGRSRKECLKIGWEMLGDKGIMILHDAQRSNYLQGIPKDCFFVQIVNPKINNEGHISTIFMSNSSRIINFLAVALRHDLPQYINVLKKSGSDLSNLLS